MFGLGAVRRLAEVAATMLVVMALVMAVADRADADGELDMGFVGPTLSGDVHAVLALPDGYALTGGAFSQVNSLTDHQWLIRHTPGGGLDSGYDPNMQFTVNGLFRQDDGKILVAGVFVAAGGEDRFRIARLAQNGDLDLAFDPPQLDGTTFTAIEVDGSVFVGGVFENAGVTPRSRIAKLSLETGGLDLDFVPPAINSTVRAIAVQDDGKVVIGGAFSMVDGEPHGRIARLNANGSLDTGFTPPFLSSDVWDVVIEPDGKIIVAGTFGNVGDEELRDGLVRLNPDGTVDDTFSPLNVTGGFPIVRDAEPLAGGGYMIAGGFTQLGGADYSRVARLDAGGVPDPDFVPPVFDDILETVDVYADGNVLVGGRFTSADGEPRSKVARLIVEPTVVPVPAALKFVGKAKPKKLRAGKVATVAVKLTNTGETSVGTGQVCPKLSKKLKKAFKPKGANKGCKAFTNLNEGGVRALKLKFKTKAKKLKRGKAYKLTLRATGTSAETLDAVPAKTIKAKVKIRK